jgi:translation initiation factor 1
MRELGDQRNEYRMPYRRRRIGGAAWDGHNSPPMKSYRTARGVVLRNAPGTLPPPATVGPAGAPAGPARVRVGREVAGRGGKAVSVIEGLPLGGTELEALARELKKLCGAGGAVRARRIEIQGEHRDRLVAELCRRGWEAKRSGG